MNYGCVYLKAGREKSVLAFHPWVFSGAIKRIDEGINNGDIVDVYTANKRYIGRGLYNEASSIAVRIMSFEQVPLNLDFFITKLLDAKQLRDSMNFSAEAVRYCNGSGDFLPGLYVDAFSGYLVVQLSSYGLVRMKDTIVNALQDVFFQDETFKGIYDRSDTVIKNEEGIDATQGVLYGEPPPEKLYVTENAVKYPVFITEGQKTGFYLDLRGSRNLLGSISAGKSILNLFSYTGSFSIKALASGAEKVVSVESSKKFCTMLDEEINDSCQQYADKHEAICANAFEYIRSLNAQYDVVVVDPPPLCKSKHDVTKSSRAYKDCNMHAIRVAKKNGFVLTLCCSHHISIDLLQKIVFGAAKDAGRMVQIVSQIGQEPDHPVNIYHPETSYFKGFLLRVI